MFPIYNTQEATYFDRWFFSFETHKEKRTNRFSLFPYVFLMKKIIILGIALTSIFFVGCTKLPDTTTTGTGVINLDAFAQCLTKANVKMFGTATCSHCLAQKKIFGESFKYVQYVDCIASPTMCSNVAAVPTWLFADGSTLQGEQKLETLAAKTNCSLTQ
jgi:glutaredoxin